MVERREITEVQRGRRMEALPDKFSAPRASSNIAPEGFDVFVANSAYRLITGNWPIHVIRCENLPDPAMRQNHHDDARNACAIF